jgi:hypothetical protein
VPGAIENMVLQFENRVFIYNQKKVITASGLRAAILEENVLIITIFRGNDFLR